MLGSNFRKLTIRVIFFSLCFTGFLYAGNKSGPVIKITRDIELIKLTESFYIHTTWFDFPGFGRYPSNGLIFIKNKKALLIDTPVENRQTELLYKFLRDSLDAEIMEVIVGHYHDDCLGGLGYLQNLGIPSVSGDLTKKKCKELKLPIPSKSFTNKMEFKFEDEQVICQYFGGGHTEDNIVVFFPDKKVLFGGCLIKSIESTSLGNTKDAVIEEWDSTVRKIINEYKHIDFVVPGHGAHGGDSLLTHTIALVDKHEKKQ